MASVQEIQEAQTLHKQKLADARREVDAVAEAMREPDSDLTALASELVAAKADLEAVEAEGRQLDQQERDAYAEERVTETLLAILNGDDVFGEEGLDESGVVFPVFAGGAADGYIISYVDGDYQLTRQVKATPAQSGQSTHRRNEAKFRVTLDGHQTEWMALNDFRYQFWNTKVHNFTNSTAMPHLDDAGSEVPGNNGLAPPAMANIVAALEKLVTGAVVECDESGHTTKTWRGAKHNSRITGLPKGGFADCRVMAQDLFSRESMSDEAHQWVDDVTDYLLNQ